MLHQGAPSGPSPRYYNKYGLLSTQFAIFDPDAFVEVKYYEITQHIDKVFAIFHSVFENVEYHAMGIPISTYWYPHMVALAEKLNRREHKGNVIHINGILMPGHFTRDKIHLNCSGYRLYMDWCVSQTVTAYYKAVRKPKQKRLADLSRSGRKRLNKKIRLSKVSK